MRQQREAAMGPHPFYGRVAVIDGEQTGKTWALVLAAGEGSRLRSLTTAASGETVPKQFCSLYEGPSLLHEALERAHTVAGRSRICAVVAEQHRHWWTGALASLPAANVIVQPENRGTGNGILLPLLHLVERDPRARIVLLPSDHHVRNEAVLASSLERAVQHVGGSCEDTVLLGLQPEEADPELGYIVPEGGADAGGFQTVERFVEKPSRELASRLIQSGALWNAFIIASTVPALLAMFRRRLPQIVTRFEAAVRSDLWVGSRCATEELYESLPAIDFSRDILCGEESNLSVLPVPPCGWSDLGTPKRVAEVLYKAPRPAALGPLQGALGYLSLATQHERLPFSSAYHRHPGA